MWLFLAHLGKRPQNLNSSTLGQLRQVLKPISIKSPLPATGGARKISECLSFRKKIHVFLQYFLTFVFEDIKSPNVAIPQLQNLFAVFATVSHSLCASKRMMAFSGKILEEDFSFWIANQ